MNDYEEFKKELAAHRKKTKADINGEIDDSVIYWTVKDICKEIPYGRDKVNCDIKNGKLKAIKGHIVTSKYSFTHANLIHPDDAKKYIEENK